MTTDEHQRADALKESATALVATLDARAREAESLRRLPDETLADLKAAGLHRMCQPARLGGAEIPLDRAVDIISTLARGCASTAWVCGVYTDHSIIAGMMDRQTTDEIWADNPDAMIAAGYLPAGNAERVPGGWRLTGTWGFASGCDFADWVLLGCLLPMDDGGKLAHLCFVPRTEIEIDDNWHVMGLEATGSKNVMVENTFVPERRTLAMVAMNGGAEGRGQTDVPALYRLPHVTAVPFMFCATIIGISESLLKTTIEQIHGRNSFGTPVAEFPTMQLHVAEAAAEIDCARMLMTRDTSEAMAAMREPRPLTLAEKARNRRDTAYAARLCARAVDRLFGASGAKGIFDDNVVQRKFRDLRAANVHIAVNWDLAGTTYGRVALGLDPITPLI